MQSNYNPNSDPNLAQQAFTPNDNSYAPDQAPETAYVPPQSQSPVYPSLPVQPVAYTQEPEPSYLPQSPTYLPPENAPQVTQAPGQWQPQPTSPTPQSLTSYPQQVEPMPLLAPLPAKTSRKRHLIQLIGSILIILSLIAIGFFLFSKLILDRTNVSANDLTEAKTDKTTYLRPKQWTKSQNGEAYGVSLDAISKNVAMISMTESPDASSYDLSKADETSISQIRSFTLEGMTDTVVKNSLRNDSFCSEVKDIKKTAGTRQTKDELDIVTVEASCTSKYGDLRVKMLIWLGSDKLLRNTLLVASSDIWPKNQESFQKMLESGTVKK